MKNKSFTWNKKGQNTIEYILIFAIVVAVLLVALGPGGFMTQSINKALDLSINAIEVMANDTTF